MIEAIAALLETGLRQVAIDLTLAILKGHGLILRRDPAIKIGYDDAGWVSNRGILSHPLRQLTAVDRRADRSANQEVIEWRLSQVQVEHDGVTGGKPSVIVL